MTSAGVRKTSGIVSKGGLATVCQEARCPNRTECWHHQQATFMILGKYCTRNCRFCAVQSATPEAVQPDEPERLADAAASMGLKHVVITAVTRDDLPDEGAGQFARCIEAVRKRCPGATIEVLPADFHARLDCISTVCQVSPDVYNHNIETVERLTPDIRPQADYRRSLSVLNMVHEHWPDIVTKSGLMVGLGETWNDLERTLLDLRDVSCRFLTVGQYLQPSSSHVEVEKFYHPDEFKRIEALANEIGFEHVAAGPFVRSSYRAGEAIG
jgi:lipoic acid synthetase